MTTYRAGQRVRIEWPNGDAVEGTVHLSTSPGVEGRPAVSAHCMGGGWTLDGLDVYNPDGRTVTVLSEPRPAEPTGLGAVVEAGTSTGGAHRTWVGIDAFDGSRNWIAPGMNPRGWSDLIDPVVLSDGWTS